MEPFRTSSYSNNGATCVEVASDDNVMVRDTTARDAFTLTVPAVAWQTFINSL